MSQTPALPVKRVAVTSLRCLEEFPPFPYPPTHPRSTWPSAHALSSEGERTIKSCVSPESATLQALKAALAELASLVQALNLSSAKGAESEVRDHLRLAVGLLPRCKGAENENVRRLSILLCLYEIGQEPRVMQRASGHPWVVATRRELNRVGSCSRRRVRRVRLKGYERAKGGPRVRSKSKLD